uniref:Putative secreted protein n=1 Tax=Anopheles marajoara TaxID=58244 RepID=A0A2M4CAP5_9DIPT
MSVFCFRMLPMISSMRPVYAVRLTVLPIRSYCCTNRACSALFVCRSTITSSDLWRTDSISCCIFCNLLSLSELFPRCSSSLATNGA